MRPHGDSVRQVHLGCEVGLEREVAHVPGYTYDGGPHRLAEVGSTLGRLVDRDPLPDRVAARPVARRQRLVHQRGVAGVGDLVGREVAAPHDRDARGAEVGRVHLAEDHLVALAAAAGLAVDLDGAVHGCPAQGNGVGERDRGDSRHPGDGGRDVTVELQRALRRVVPGRRRLDWHGGQPVHVETHRHPLKPRKALEQQARGGREHERERDLAHHQRRPEAPPGRSESSTSAFPERGRERSRRPERRQEAERYHDHEREDGGGDEDNRVDRDLVGPREEIPGRNPDPAHYDERQGEPARRCERAEHDGLRGQQPEQRPASAAERGTDGQLARAPSCAGESEGSDVDAGDQQHHGGGRSQQTELRPGVAEDLGGDRHQRRPGPAAVLCRIGLRQARSDDGKRLLSGGGVHTGTEPADDATVHVNAALRERGVGRLDGGDRRPEIGPGGIGVSGRHHPHHGVVPVAKREASAEGGAVAAEAPLPELPGEHHRAGRPRRPVGGPERAADRGLLGQHAEVLIGHERAYQPLRAPLESQDRAEPAGERHRLERVGARLPVQEREVGREPDVGGRVALGEEHDPVGGGVGKRADDDGAKHARDGCGAADAERQGEDDGEAVAGGSAKGADGQVQIAHGKQIRRRSGALLDAPPRVLAEVLGQY